MIYIFTKYYTMTEFEDEEIIIKQITAYKPIYDNLIHYSKSNGGNLRKVLKEIGKDVKNILNTPFQFIYEGNKTPPCVSTYLFIAIQLCNEEFVKILLEFGADSEIGTKDYSNTGEFQTAKEFWEIKHKCDFPKL